MHMMDKQKSRSNFNDWFCKVQNHPIVSLHPLSLDGKRPPQTIDYCIKFSTLFIQSFPLCSNYSTRTNAVPFSLLLYIVFSAVQESNIIAIQDYLWAIHLVLAEYRTWMLGEDFIYDIFFSNLGTTNFRFREEMLVGMHTSVIFVLK